MDFERIPASIRRQIDGLPCMVNDTVKMCFTMSTPRKYRAHPAASDAPPNAKSHAALRHSPRRPHRRICVEKHPASVITGNIIDGSSQLYPPVRMPSTAALSSGSSAPQTARSIFCEMLPSLV